MPGGTQYDKIEAYWRRYANTPEPQRYFRIMEEERPFEAWLQALDRLTRTINRHGEAETSLRFDEYLTDECVDSLLSNIKDRVGREPSLREDSFKSHATIAVAVYLLDKTQASEYLASAIQNLTDTIESEQDRSSHYRIGSEARQITILRLQLGDMKAVGEFVSLINATDQGRWISPMGMHLPALLFPEIPEFKKLVLDSFQFLRTELAKEPLRVSGSVFEIAPYLAIDDLRDDVAELLADDTALGTVILEKADPQPEGLDPGLFDGYETRAALPGPGGMKWHVRAPVDDLKHIGLERKLRRCDLFALDLARVKIGPEFRLYWPIERRDEVIGQYKRLVMTVKYDAIVQPWAGYYWWLSREPVTLRTRS
ncbi:MAG: hypothetical protein IIA68_03470 [Proteobacteria bacterium]|nr:hypothetical protein [Pseudomonadota bacterium]